MIKFIKTLILFLPFVLFSCNSDDNGETTGKTYKVRYEASCDNPNTTLRILYTTKNTDFEHISEDAKEVFVKSPFSTELEMKYGDYCYISSSPHIDENSGIVDENITYKNAIYVDNVKVAEKINKGAAVAYYLLVD